MALPEIPIDDRTYDQLFAVLRKGLPADYTDHNPSDPAVTLLELFCWLGELSLYQMSRSPKEHQNEYRNLLLDAPEPVTVPVTFTVSYGTNGPHDVIVPAGTRIGTEFTGGRRSVFETLKTITIPAPVPAAATSKPVVIQAREFLEVRDELLGNATGLPGQVFTLSPVRSVLGLAPDAPAPVLTDYVHRSADYDPNPEIRVFRGLLSGIATAGLALPGVLAVDFDADPKDTAFFLSFTPPSLILIRADGVGQSVAVAPGPIPPGTTQSVVFPAFRASIRLGSAFDKTGSITPSANQATVSGGTGSITPATIAVVGTTGSITGITSTEIVLGRLTDPPHLSANLSTGYSGSFDGNTPGVKQVVLRDADGNSLTIQFNVATAFNGLETAASLSVRQLANLVAFSGEIWTSQHSLLTERSGPTSRHVRVDPLSRTVHFGDGRFGALPPRGAPVVCRRYQVLRGPPSLIDEGAIQYLLTPLDTLQSGDKVSVKNDEAAFGGQFFYTPEDRPAAGLADFRKPFRLVTAHDFERVLLQDFNDYQKLARRPQRLARVAAVTNRVPPLSNDVPQPGHVTVMVIPESPSVFDEPFKRKIRRFLEERRLITTQVHVVEPEFLPFRIEISFVLEIHSSVVEMQSRVRDALLGFFDPLKGGIQGGGWPLGRGVFRSEIFRLIEDLPGVDHVESLSLSPANAEGDGAIGPHQLPRLQSVSATAVRPQSALVL